MVDHLRLQHSRTKKAMMGPVSIAPKTSVLRSRRGLVVTPINNTTTVYTKPKVLQGQNPNLRTLLPKKVDEMVGCQVCKVKVQASLMAFHMEQAHRGATFPARTVTVVPTKVLLGKV